MSSIILEAKSLTKEYKQTSSIRPHKFTNKKRKNLWIYWSKRSR